MPTHTFREALADTKYAGHSSSASNVSVLFPRSSHTICDAPAVDVSQRLLFRRHVIAEKAVKSRLDNSSVSGQSEDDGDGGGSGDDQQTV